MSQNKFPIVLLKKGGNVDQLDADVSVEFLLDKDTCIRVRLEERSATGEWKVKVTNTKQGGIAVEPCSENSILITGTK